MLFAGELIADNFIQSLASVNSLFYFFFGFFTSIFQLSRSRYGKAARAQRARQQHRRVGTRGEDCRRQRAAATSLMRAARGPVNEHGKGLPWLQAQGVAPRRPM
jgi:hypothetical protein